MRCYSECITYRHPNNRFRVGKNIFACSNFTASQAQPPAMTPAIYACNPTRPRRRSGLSLCRTEKRILERFLAFLGTEGRGLPLTYTMFAAALWDIYINQPWVARFLYTPLTTRTARTALTVLTIFTSLLHSDILERQI